MNEEQKTEVRRLEKTRRMSEKLLRMPLNDVVLEVQKGWIDIKDLFKVIDEKVKEKANEKL